MIPLKEDGSLDIERINNLPIDEYINGEEIIGYLFYGTYNRIKN